MNFILGTAGHIDHGKSSLVQALTGTNPDRLPEEKKRGVTIELGFAHLSLPHPTQAGHLEIGLIDVPGHADFVNNMVAGVGALDLALLIVAADDGWMPQTEEHVQILSYLGITNVIVALTKIDLAEDPDFSVEFVRDSLESSAYAEAPILPVSSKTGSGLSKLKEAIANALAEATPPEDLGIPFLPVDRAFSVKGMGTIVTGTLSRGELAAGDEVILQPDGLTAHVRSIQNHNRALEVAQPGMRTAVNIPDQPLDSRKQAGVKRGLILTRPEAGTPHDTLDVYLTREARPIPGQPSSKRPIRNNQNVRVHFGSGRVNARIRLPAGELKPGESTTAQLRLDTPLLALTHDRLVLRDWSGDATIAGALILDPLASRRLIAKDQHQARLDELARDRSAKRLLQHLLEKALHLPGRPSPQVFPFSNRAFKDATKELLSSGKATKTAKGLVESHWWTELLEISKQEVLAYHKENPDLPGLPLQALRSTLLRHLRGVDLFDAVIDSLHDHDIRQKGENLLSLHHSTDIPDELKAEAEDIIAELKKDLLNPPNRKDLSPNSKAQRALAFLIRTQVVVSLDEKTVIHKDALDLSKELVTNHLNNNGQATASDLRQQLNTSRRVAMPLLEHLDANGLTVREGDYRRLKS
ncbi:MAG: selenocysteine-specific translation elongation factor [Verrucomicrobiota bacterium JB023]|nr:selenocysteine-specific translation elongation factor [Verrucomicrobiota bacterium JB023]